MKILVAGGRGFIGRAACARLAGHEVQATGRDDTDARAGEAWHVLVWAAGARRATLDENLADHVAAAERAARSPALRRIVYLSSGEIYGVQPVPFREDAPRLAQTPYGRAKIAGEDAMAAIAQARGLALIVLRPAVVYGPGQTGAMLVPALIDALRAGRRFPMTRGAQTRDYVFVDDVAAAIARACADDAPAGTYNLGSGAEIAVIEVATKLAALVGPRAIDQLDAGAVPYRDGDQMAYCLDSARARSALGWAPAVSLDDGLARTVATALASAHR